MMTTFLLHFALGTLTSLAVAVVCARLSGEETLSLPSAPFVVGTACALLAHFLSPWATPAVLSLYLAAGVQELRRTRGALRMVRSKAGPPTGEES